jgi:hypothetical protein
MLVLDHRKIKITAIMLGAFLMGGLGCAVIDATNVAVEAAEHTKASAEFKIKQVQHFKALAVLAEKGDLAAQTELGIEHLSNSAYMSFDHQKGKALIEAAANKSYAPAQFILGAILIAVGQDIERFPRILPRLSNSISDVFSKNQELGIELIKESAQQQCKIDYIRPEKDGFSNVLSEDPTAVKIQTLEPAIVLNVLYEVRSYTSEYDLKFPVNKELSQLWLARSILHCNSPSNSGDVLRWTSDSHERQNQIDDLSFALIMPYENWIYTVEELRDRMNEEDRALAVQQAAHWRKAVADSEKKYPAPEFPVQDKNNMIKKGKEKLNDSFSNAKNTLGNNKYFLEVTQHLAAYSPYTKEYASIITEASATLIGINALNVDKKTGQHEYLSSAEELLDSYIDVILPLIGKSETGEYLNVASMGLILAVNNKNQKTSKKIFEKILGGKSFNIQTTKNLNLVYNLACYYAVNHQKTELLIICRS